MLSQDCVINQYQYVLQQMLNSSDDIMSHSSEIVRYLEGAVESILIPEQLVVVSDTVQPAAVH